MEKKSDKKTIIILLIILAIAIIGGGIWTYSSLNSFETTSDTIDTTIDTFSELRIEQVYAIKDEAKQNIQDFLKTKLVPETIWKDFYEDDQFKTLNDMDLSIDIDGYLNNPNPFVIPSSTQALR